MARMRTVKPGFFTSEGIAPGLLLRTRLTFVGLWTYCDDHGRGKDNARLIKSEVWPLDDDVTLDLVEADLGALVRSGHLVRYEADGGRFLAIQKWHYSQSPNHPQPTVIPDPPVSIAVPAPGEKKHCPACWAASERVPDRSGTVPGPFNENPSGYPQPPGQTFPERSGNVPGRSRRGVGGEKEGEGADAPPPPRCTHHVDNPSPGPCGACKDARLARKAWDASAEKRDREALLKQRECPHCDADGFRYEPGTRVPKTPYERCNHLRSVS